MKRSTSTQVEILESRTLLCGVPVLSEFQAAVSSDEMHGNPEGLDWIELFNPHDCVVDLNHYFLSDNLAQPQKWRFPVGEQLYPGEFKLVYASSRNTVDEFGKLHTNFGLDKAGDSLILADERQIVDQVFANFPPQFQGISYGRTKEFANVAESIPSYFAVPTPGLPNDSIAYAEVLNAPTIPMMNARLRQAQSVTLSSNNSNADLIYTTDGSLPTESNGTRIVAPAGEPATTKLQLTHTTVIHAIAVGQNAISSVVASGSFIFLQDVLTQRRGESQLMDALSDEWMYYSGLGEPDITTADYEMNADVVAEFDESLHPELPTGIRASLTALPTVSIVVPDNELWGQNGIYEQSRRRDLDARGTVQFMDFDGGPPVSALGVVEIHGNRSRAHQITKHSLRIDFTQDFRSNGLGW